MRIWLVVMILMNMNEGVMCYVVRILLLLFVGCYVSFVNNF